MIMMITLHIISFYLVLFSDDHNLPFALPLAGLHCSRQFKQAMLTSQVAVLMMKGNSQTFGLTSSTELVSSNLRGVILTRHTYRAFSRDVGADMMVS